MKRVISLVTAALLSVSVLAACSSNAYESDMTEISDLNQIKANQETQNASLSEEIERLNSEISNLNKSQTSLQSEVSSLKKEKNSLTSQVSELKKENSDLNQKVKTTETSKPAETSIQVSETSESVSFGENIYIGDTIHANGYDLTLNNVSLTYKAMPDNPPSHYTYYEAKVGKIYIKIDATIKNTSKVGLDCDEVYIADADYNNGFTYSGFPVADDYDGDFTYASITRIDPLETLGVHYLIDCPE